VKLAVRCQHIRRWEIPRASYPRTPEGYQVWRARLLEHYVAGFVAGHPDYGEAKLRDILQKTFRKMSPRGRNAVPTLIRLPAALAPFVLAAAGDEARGRMGIEPRR